MRVELTGEPLRWVESLSDTDLRRRFGGGTVDKAKDYSARRAVQTLSTGEHGRLVDTWLAEAATLCPELSVVAVTETERKSGIPIAKAVIDADVVATSYALFRIDEDAYQTQRWSGLVLDEAQFVKNHQAKTYVCARRLPAGDHRHALGELAHRSVVAAPSPWSGWGAGWRCGRSRAVHWEGLAGPPPVGMLPVARGSRRRVARRRAVALLAVGYLAGGRDSVHHRSKVAMAAVVGGTAVVVGPPPGWGPRWHSPGHRMRHPGPPAVPEEVRGAFPGARRSHRWGDTEGQPTTGSASGAAVRAPRRTPGSRGTWGAGQGCGRAVRRPGRSCARCGRRRWPRSSRQSAPRAPWTPDAVPPVVPGRVPEVNRTRAACRAAQGGGSSTAKVIRSA